MLAIAYLLAGAAAVVAGVAVLAGLGWALVAGGTLVLALGVLEARGGGSNVQGETRNDAAVAAHLDRFRRIGDQ